MSFSFLMILLAEFPTDLKHECLMFLMRLHRRSPSPFMPPFGAYYPPMMAPIPVPPGPSELSSDPSPNSEGSKRAKADWTRDETSVLLEIWGAIHDSLKSASTAQKKSLWSQI